MNTFCQYAAALVACVTTLGSREITAADIRADAAHLFETAVRPLFKEYCVTCHSTKKHKGDLDLERFTSFREVLEHPEVWQNVSEQLANKEMPPKDKPQLAPEERDRIFNWANAVVDEIALARAGDPGPVLLRRLSNAEYTYTLRDLTEIESLDPAREFPVDGAAGEGFMNTGNALVMSPSLLTKYLDAGKGIAAHVVLLPDGIRFSPKATRRDWTEEILGEIRSSYREFTDPGGGDTVNLQGIVFETNEGGRLPLEKYLAASLELRHRRNFSEPRDPTSEALDAFTSLAAARGLSAKYLETLWSALTNTEPSVLLDPLRVRWRDAGRDEAAAIAAEIAQWQKALWKFSRVGHIGKVGGPKAWMEAMNPLTTKHELRVKIPAPEGGNEITLYLVAGDAGDGNEHDFVIWHKPRLVATGKPDLLLRDARPVIHELNPHREQGYPNRTSHTTETDAVRSSKRAIPPEPFGLGPKGKALDPASVCVRAPSVVEIHLPADVAAGYEFATTGVLDEGFGTEGSVQLQVLTTKPQLGPGLQPSAIEIANTNAPWTSNNQRVSLTTPILVRNGSAARTRFEAEFDQFRRIFPAALCYTKIVPVDEVVTLTLFYREDHHLARLMLDQARKAKLDRLWDELHFVSQDALMLVDAFEQLWQYATQDADPKVFEPLRQPIQDRAAAFRKLLVDTEPKHLEAAIDFARRAYRRPLTDLESDEMRELYRKLRQQKLPHNEAIRLTLARVFVAPAFLYKLEKAAPGSDPGPVSDWELASRLSYFLWSSMPDAELLEKAAAGKLHSDGVLVAQTRRMLRDSRIRRLAIEFACQWLHIRDFDTLDEKSERHFPAFTSLRGDMYEESIRFFTDLFQHDRSVLNILDADYSFLNQPLAKHYGIPGISGPEFRRVDGVRAFSRGGILGHATTLAKPSGASRTSPILRGNWVAEALLGDRLPRPPKDVPRLPEDETATEGLTVRQLVEKHSNGPNCSGCHIRIDPFGYALEGFDAIGRRREKDLGDRPIDTRAKVIDGTEFADIDGLRDYLLDRRRDDFVRQFCRKLLGYALGRAVQISDRPLLAEMQAQLRASDYRIAAVIETIVRSQQFRQIRGQE